MGATSNEGWLAIEPVKPVGEVRLKHYLDATLGERSILDSGTSAVLTPVASDNDEDIGTQLVGSNIPVA
jgi:hypothetical protein